MTYAEFKRRLHRLGVVFQRIAVEAGQVMIIVRIALLNRLQIRAQRAFVPWLRLGRFAHELVHITERLEKFRTRQASDQLLVQRDGLIIPALCRTQLGQVVKRRVVLR